MGIYNEEWTTSFSVSWHWWFWFVSANSINIKAQPANMIDKCAKFLKLMTFVSLFCCCVLDWKQVRVCNGNHLFWAEHGFFFSVCFLIKGITACSMIEIYLWVGRLDSIFQSNPVSQSTLRISQCPLYECWFMSCVFFLIIDCNRDVCFSVNRLLLTLNYWRTVIEYFPCSGLFLFSAFYPK